MAAQGLPAARRRAPARALTARYQRRSSQLPTLIGSLIYCALVAADPIDPAASPGMLGFSAAHALDEQATERAFDADLNPAQLREWMQSMASEPNQVGSAHDQANAELLLRKFRQWGWDARIETFSVLYPTPRHWEQAVQYIGITARALETYCDRLDAATALLHN